jgi:hypothetical protein
MKVTAQLYGQFLLSSQINYTGTYLADHVAGLTHDNVTYFLKTERFAPRQVWKKVRALVDLSPKGYIIFDDTVLNKEHSHRIELVRRQYSGNAKGIIKGIGVVNCVYVSPETREFWLIDYRVFQPDQDGKTKIDHVLEMLAQLAPRGVSYRTVLMDSWYAVAAIFKWLMEEGKIFYCPIKTNRKVDDSNGQARFQPVSYLSWSAQEVAEGKRIRLYGMPAGTSFKLFRFLVSTHQTDYLITNDIEQQDTNAAAQESDLRWLVEQFHREIKQVTGIESCQCRKSRSQRNHLALAALTWVRLKSLAYKAKTTVYQLKQRLLDDYMTRELADPTIVFA